MFFLLGATLICSRAEYIMLSDLTGKEESPSKGTVFRPHNAVQQLTRRVTPSSGAGLSVCIFPPLSFSLSKKGCSDLPVTGREDVVPTQTVECSEVPDISALDLGSDAGLAKSLENNPKLQPFTLSFGDCGKPGSLPDVDSSHTVVAFVLRDEATESLAEAMSRSTVSNSYLVPVVVLKSSMIPASQSKLKAALSSALHTSNPIHRMEALEAIKSASVKLALIRN